MIFKQINYFLIAPLLLHLNAIEKLYSKISHLKKIIQSGNPEGESCYYSGPQLTALGQISPIIYRANQPEGHEIKGGHRGP
jgi:hypothetical protein